MRLLMIDNYDSFTYNLVQLFGEFDIDTLVYRHDAVDLDAIGQCRPDWICISPGPKTPAHAGISKSVVKRFGAEIPILGVCLGMQAINEVFGGETRRAPEPRHGKCSSVTHSGEGVFQGLPAPFQVARYHSLQAIMHGTDLRAVAHAEDGVVMGLQHRRFPIHGVQFHPESFMSDYGLELVANFLSTNPKYGARQIPESLDGSRFPRHQRGSCSGFPVAAQRRPDRSLIPRQPPTRLSVA